MCLEHLNCFVFLANFIVGSLEVDKKLGLGCSETLWSCRDFVPTANSCVPLIAKRRAGEEAGLCIVVYYATYKACFLSHFIFLFNLLFVVFTFINLAVYRLKRFEEIEI